MEPRSSTVRDRRHEERSTLNILLLQLKRIGDLVLTTPAIAAIRSRYANANLTLVTSTGSAGLSPAIGGIDQVLVARGTLQNAGIWSAIAPRRFDYCIDFTHTDRSAFLTFLSHAKKRITSNRLKAHARARSLVYNEFVAASVRQLHTVDYHLALLQPLGIIDASPKVSLEPPPAERARADEILRAKGIDGPFAVLHPGSARAEKFWHADRWTRVIEHCAARNLQCVLTGSDSAMEQAHIADIKAAGRAPVIDLSGLVGLCSLTALLAKARFLVTVDSAPMHLAAAMRTPQLILFGPTNPFHWRPRFTPAVVLQAGHDAALAEFSPEMSGAPMNQISTNQVIDAMETLLSAPAASAP